MSQTDAGVPKALRDVWAWKDAVYREVENLPVDQALAAIFDRAERTAPERRSGNRGPDDDAIQR